MTNKSKDSNIYGKNTLSNRIAQETQICRQTKDILRKLHPNNKALAKELNIQYNASKKVQEYFNKDLIHWNGSDAVDDNQPLMMDPREFLYSQMYLAKETNIKLKMKLWNDASMPEIVECFENLRRNKQKLIFLKEMLSESRSNFKIGFSNLSSSVKTTKKPVFLRIIGCDRISRSFSLKSIMSGLPRVVQKSIDDSALEDSGANINATVRCDLLIDGVVIFSTVSREPSLQCWNTTFDYVHDFSKRLEIQVVWLAPYQHLSGIISKEASRYKSLDFMLSALSYLSLDEEVDRGFTNRTIELFPNGRVFLETFLKPPLRTKNPGSTLPHTISSHYSSLSRTSPLPGFSLCALLGTGHFGKIILCQKLSDRNYYALKIIQKRRIMESDDYEQIISEKMVLEVIKKHNHPLMVHLFSCLQDTGHIMFVLEFIQAGDLATLIHCMGKFSDEQAQFYIASVTLCLDFLHHNNIMYRDLKMENLLLDSAGYIKLVDFGLSKLNMDRESTTRTFCGTIDYMAPEVLSGGSYSRMIDWWALGVLLFYMLIGQVPFSGSTDIESFDAILNESVAIPLSVNAITSSIIISLLNRNPKSRLGSRNGATEVKIHPYFSNINFHRILKRKVSAPFVPDLKHQLDLSFFDRQFTAQRPTLSVDDVDLSGDPDAKIFFDEFV